MAKTVCPPRHRWQPFAHQGRNFARFDLRVGDDRIIPFSVAERIAERYEVVGVLARGGGGVILVANDLKTRHRVLVKTIAEHDTSRADLGQPLDDFVESLRRARHHLQTERRLLVQLRNKGCNAVPHPNNFVFDYNAALTGPHRCVSGEEWTFDDDALLNSEPYLVMQHVAGVSMKQLLANYYRRGLDETVALRIIDQVARVIELLHQPLQLSNGQTWNLVYQDLKPGNVLVDEYGHATVLDFGGCQLEIEGELVLHGSHSPGYCPPECGQGIPVTQAADTYGLGCALYCLLSGDNPRRMLPEERPPGSPPAVHIDASMLAERCSAAVVAFVARSVDWDINARFATAREFRVALAELLTGI